MVGFLLLLAFALTAFGIVIASRMQRMESFQMVMALVMQPMMFLSGAIFPLDRAAGLARRAHPAQPGHVRRRRASVASCSPAPRLTILGWAVPLWADALITLGFGTVMLLLAVKLFDRTE